MIGTNRDLKSIQRHLDCRIMALSRPAGAAAEQAWVTDQLTALARQRITVSSILANRRIEAAKQVVDFSRWLSGNGILCDAARRAGREDAAGREQVCIETR